MALSGKAQNMGEKYIVSDEETHNNVIYYKLQEFWEKFLFNSAGFTAIDPLEELEYSDEQQMVEAIAGYYEMPDILI